MSEEKTVEEKPTIFSGQHALLILGKPKHGLPRTDLVKLIRQSGMLKRMKEDGVDFFVLGEMGVSDLNSMDKILSSVSGEPVKVEPGQMLIIFVQNASGTNESRHESPIVTFAGELEHLVTQAEEQTLEDMVEEKAGAH